MKWRACVARIGPARILKRRRGGSVFGMAYDLGLAVCGVVPDLGNCLDRQGVTMLGMFILAVAGALPVLAALSRI